MQGGCCSPWGGSGLGSPKGGAGAAAGWGPSPPIFALPVACRSLTPLPLRCESVGTRSSGAGRRSPVLASHHIGPPVALGEPWSERARPATLPRESCERLQFALTGLLSGLRQSPAYRAGSRGEGGRAAPGASGERWLIPVAAAGLGSTRRCLALGELAAVGPWLLVAMRRLGGMAGKRHGHPWGVPERGPSWGALMAEPRGAAGAAGLLYPPSRQSSES